MQYRKFCPERERIQFHVKSRTSKLFRRQPVSISEQEKQQAQCHASVVPILPAPMTMTERRLTWRIESIGHGYQSSCAPSSALGIEITTALAVTAVTRNDCSCHECTKWKRKTRSLIRTRDLIPNRASRRRGCRFCSTHGKTPG